MYDIAGDSWARLQDLPCRPVGSLQSAFGFGPSLFVGGTEDCVPGDHRSQLQQYDVETDTWRLLPSMAVPRLYCAAARLHDKLYFMSGYGNGHSSIHESFDILSRRWSFESPVPVARAWAAAAAVNDEAILVIGGTLLNGEDMSRVDQFSPSRSGGIGYFCECVEGVCGNEKALAGCENGTGTGGYLTASGSASVIADDLVITAVGLPRDVIGFAIMGTESATRVFGNGRLCVLSTEGITRFPPQWTGTVGMMVLGPSIVAQAPHIHAGSSPAFQFVFRDPSGPCGTSMNATQAVGVLFEH